MLLPAAEGPNQSPAGVEHAFSPWRTNLWIENGESGESRNQDIIVSSETAVSSDTAVSCSWLAPPFLLSPPLDSVFPH